MAAYDYICIEWGDGCPVDNIYYAGGFYNRLYFDEEMQPPQFEIEDEGKKADGTMLAERQVWSKKYAIDIRCPEWVATVLSTIPLHETVRIIDKDGNTYYCNGPDVTIDIQAETNKEYTERTYYPVMIVKLTFNAHQIIKTACCGTLAAAECSETVPTIDSISEIGAGTMNIEGTAPEPMLVRLYERDWIDPVQVEVGGKINDVCIVSATVAYCCTNSGDIYKTTNGGQTWARVGGGGGAALNGIAFDGVDKIFVVGGPEGGDSLTYIATVGTDTFVEKATPSNVNLNAVRAHNGNAFACGANGVVLFYDGSAGTWSDISIGTVAILYDLEIHYSAPDYRIAVVGVNVRAYTDNTGAVWSESGAAATYRSIALISWTNTGTGTWVIGDTTGSIWVTNNNLTDVLEDAGIFANQIVGLSAATIAGDRYCVGMDSSGYYRYFTGADTWGDTYKQRSQPTSNRIRLAAKGTEMLMMSALGNGNVGTTETPYTENQAVTAASYNSGGMQFAGANNVTYQLYVETYTFTTDPCEESTVEIFTT